MTRPIVPLPPESYGGDHGGRGGRNKKPEKGSLKQVKPKGERLRFQFNPESVTESGGVGGWGRMTRPKRKVALNWMGQPERMLTFTLIFDKFETMESVEDKCRLLRSFGNPTKREGSKKGKRPPVLQMEYGPAGRGDWVIDDLAWGQEVRNAKLDRVYVEVTVTLVEYVEAEGDLSPADRHRDRNG